MDSCIYLQRTNCVFISPSPFLHTMSYVLFVHYEVDPKHQKVSRISEGFQNVFLEVPKLSAGIQIFAVQEIEKQTI